MARVNAFLFLLRSGRPENSAYVTDFDLLPAGHPKSTKRSASLIIETRATPPNYMQRAAARGLELRAEGYGGDGLTDKTVRDAREMAAGRMSDAKIIDANAWAARHAVDLESPQNNDSSADGWPGAGAVAHYLWGIDPLNPQPARDWLARESQRLKDERTAMTNLEIREIRVADLEMHDYEDGIPATFSGYAAVFNSDSEPLPFIETIAPGAFSRSLKSRNDVRMYVNHDDNMVLASRRSGTLSLEEDSRGLKVTATMPDTSYARDLVTLMRDGIVDSMSFGFSVPRGGDEWSGDGMRRKLNEVRLHEVSVVTGVPAYAATSAMVRKVAGLAQRTATTPDDLADAMNALLEGNVTPDQADLLRAVVNTVAPETTPDASLEVLRERLDLAAKAL